MFMALMLGMFLFAYREQWLMVAFLGIFISATRNLGVMMVFPVLILALQAYGWREFFRFTERAFRWCSPSGSFPSASSPTWSISITSPGMPWPSSTSRWPGAAIWTAPWTGG
jgi:hypothetical protein